MDAPTPKFPFKHKLPIQVRFNDFDSLGHINNTIYLQYMDLGKSDYILLALGDTFDLKRHSLVVVHLDSDFFAPTKFGEPIEVLSCITHITKHTLTFEQRVINSDTGEVKCTSTSVMVGFDAVEESKMEINEHWRHLISAFEAREI